MLRDAAITSSSPRVVVGDRAAAVAAGWHGTVAALYN
jgi:hypothetical protein